MGDIFEKRVSKVIRDFNNDQIQAFVVTRGTDIRYLTGFTGEAGVAAVILTNNKKYFITDGRFTNQASQELNGYEIFQWKQGSGLYGQVGEILKDINIKEAIADFQQISHKNYQVLIKNYDNEVKDCKPYISDTRKVKDEEEIKSIRRACNITEKSFFAVLDKIQPGQTEKDIKNLLEYEFTNNGGEGAAFPIIIASGADNGANPHATVSDRKIQKGDMVTIDFGAAYNGYCSDVTRTISIGKPSEELMNIYRVVKEAKDCGVAKLKAGVPAKEIDIAIRDTIKNAGYVLPHGPGHGFGLDIHEDPFLGPNNQYNMEENVIHTIEPGIYVPGVGGVRIEDDYMITKDGYELLTPNISQELIII